MAHDRTLNVFKLAMITIICVDSIRNLPIIAQYGFSLITFYIIAGLTFFIPLIFITARFADEYPHTGGSYLWVQDAFGKKWAIVSIWLQWIYQMIWYPTIFAFICTTIAALIHPGWEVNTWFILPLSLVLFWSITLLAAFGMNAASWVSAVGAIIGTLLPMLAITLLAVYWLASGQPAQITMTWSALIPNQHALLNLGFFANILFSLLGLDVAAMHAGDVKDPKSTYKKAMGIAGMLILVSLIFSSLALCIVVPPAKIGLLNGLMQAFVLFFSAYHLSWLVPVIGLAIILGSVGIAFGWMSSLVRGVHVACVSAQLFKPLQKLNQHGMPHIILLIQALIFSLLMIVFLVFPNINNSYWMLSALTSQFALIYYVVLFAAAIKLRHSVKAIKISAAKKIARIFLPSLAIITSIIGIAVGFLPPSSIPAGGVPKYELLLGCGFILFSAPLWFIFRKMEHTQPASKYEPLS
jgi:amino acid transporter